MTPFEQWFSGFAGSATGRALLGRSDIARGMLAKVVPQADRDLRMLERALEPRAGGAPAKAYAYCFCGF